MTSVPAPSGSPASRWLLVAALAALALLALERMVSLSGQAPAVAPVPAPIMAGIPKTYEAALARIEQSIDDAKERAESRSSEWLMHEVLARRYLAKARLTGSFDDYAAADAALQRAFAVARPGTGPHMTQAALDFTMHRLAGAERMLNAVDGYAVPPDRGERAEILAMRGDIAFYRGRYEEAAALYDEADRLAPGAADFRRAVYHSRTGRPDLSEDFFERVRAGSRTPQSAAAVELQHGILDLERGRRDDALAHFNEADRIFPGYWLIEEHIAEVTALKGDLAGAERRYRDIVRRTGNPEFMDALGLIAVKRGDRETAKVWFDRAATIWRVRLRQFPEAAYGHALNHCIAAGNWSCAVDLARRNHANRPYGEARLFLAKALIHVGRADEALGLVEQVLASPWRTAQTHAVASEVYSALGRDAEADAQARLARAIDPHVIIQPSRPVGRAAT